MRSARWSSTACSGCRPCCRSTRPAWRAVSPDSAFNTAVSFVTNTNWQGYAGESTMSYLTQMLGLDGAELPLGRHRHRGRLRAGPRLRARARRQGLRRQLLGRRDAHHRCGCCCRSRSCSRSFLVGQGVIQNFDAYKDVTTRRDHGLPAAQAGRRRPAAEGRSGQPGDGGRAAPRRRRWPWARSLRRKRSRCSAPTAAASSTPTRRIPTRTRRALANFVQMLAIFLIPAALCFAFGRVVGDHAPGLGRAGGDDGDVRRRGARDHPGRAGRQSAARRRWASTRRPARCRPAATWKARKCASASPPRRCSPPITTAASCGAVNAMHDSLHAAGRHGAAGADAAGRGGVRRRRHRPLRHADLRDPGGLHRRPDDRPHARVPRQEDRGATR